MRLPRELHRRVLLAALAVGLVALAAGGATFAAFTTQARNDANLFATGTVQMTDDDAGSAMFSLAGMKPTDAPVDRCILVTYTGSLESSVRLYSMTSGDLAPYLDLTVTRGSGGSFGSCGSFTSDATDYIGKGQGVVYSGTLDQFPGDYTQGIVDPPGSSETWTTSESHAYRFTVSIQNDLSARTKTAAAVFVWEARNL